MKLARLPVLLVAVLAFLAVAVGSGAGGTSADCTAQLSELQRNPVEAEATFTNAKDFAHLVQKLDAASSELAAGKNADAVQKLRDFQAKLNALATPPKPKVDPALASSLVRQAEAVIGCVEATATA